MKKISSEKASDTLLNKENTTNKVEKPIHDIKK